mmetsp:Transcript_86914/g.181897  ORF Transcript_86914/g.181897 Transcript_86914/m.181897 type:complete len:640 (+) Transcript_86914:84-2003(+)
MSNRPSTTSSGGRASLGNVVQDEDVSNFDRSPLESGLSSSVPNERQSLLQFDTAQLASQLSASPKLAALGGAAGLGLVLLLWLIFFLFSRLLGGGLPDELRTSVLFENLCLFKHPVRKVASSSRHEVSDKDGDTKEFVLTADPCTPEADALETQTWKYDTMDFSVRSRQGLCLDAAEGFPVPLLSARSCSGSEAQRWVVDEGRLRLASEAKCVGKSIVTGNFEVVDCGGTNLQLGMLQQFRQTGSTPAWLLEFGDTCAVAPKSGEGKISGEACPSESAFVQHPQDSDVGQIHLGGGYCLEAPWSYSEDRSALVRQCDLKSANQNFTAHNTGQLTSGGQCLQVSGNGDSRKIELHPCEQSSDGQYWKVGSAAALRNAPAPVVVSDAPLLEFYVYRAVNSETPNYELGEINSANMDGVMWYLMNEVVTEYTAGPRCPRKFHIDVIKRYRVRYRPTEEIYKQHMNFGVRFAYDRGQCTGRCFPNNQCTCSHDCGTQFHKYGHVLGCNNFRDNYPFPVGDTPAPDGVWYSMPLRGRCKYPTGSRDCTWSYEEAGQISLRALEQTTPGKDQCCEGICTDFWSQQFDKSRMKWRSWVANNLFEHHHPQMPRELQTPCDFRRDAWYQVDNWDRKDPWAAHCTEADR